MSRQIILNTLQKSKQPMVLVLVEKVWGSTPREIGATILVGDSQIFGTIGGGNLEFETITLARKILREGGINTKHIFKLGASVGQCCGGSVGLSFVTVCPGDNIPKILLEDEKRMSVVVFGAGHVGRALIHALYPLPVHITWVDEREQEFAQYANYPKLPENVTAIITDSPETEVAQAKSGSCFLVMTHNHTLDLLLCEKILACKDFAYFGLIGSKNKRKIFERRLQHKNVIGLSNLHKMFCPIGLTGINGKAPSIVALAIAAELMQIFTLTKENSPDNSVLLSRRQA